MTITATAWRRLIAKMRDNAKQNGKTVPTFEELAPECRDACPICTLPYHPIPGENLRRRPSLQHWPDGRHTICCFACNASHGNLKRPDDVTLRATGLRRCSQCDTVKPDADYHDHNGVCRPCLRTLTRAWAANNPASHRQQKREWAKRRRARMTDNERMLARAKNRADTARSRAKKKGQAIPTP